MWSEHHSFGRVSPLTFSAHVHFVSQLKRAPLGLRVLASKETATYGTSIQLLHLYTLKHARARTHAQTPLWPWRTPFLSLEPEALGSSVRRAMSGPGRGLPSTPTLQGSATGEDWGPARGHPSACWVLCGHHHRVRLPAHPKVAVAVCH